MMVKNYSEALFENEILVLNRLVLRRFRKEDADAILAYGSDEESLRFLSWNGVKTLEEARASIYEYYWSKPGKYAIELKETGNCIGSFDLQLISEHEKATVGCILNRNFWNKGYMTEALNAILKLCFEKLCLNRVEALHYVGNEQSGRVMEKCGMKLEGVANSQFKVKGKFFDAVHYGITSKEWSGAAGS